MPMTGWFNHGSPPGNIIVGDTFPILIAPNQDGRLEAFVEGANTGNISDRELWHIWQMSPNNGWSNWSSLGSPPNKGLNGKVVGRNQSGQLEVFAVDSSGQIVHIAQTSPNDGWGTWTQLGFITKNVDSLAVGISENGQQEVYAVTPPDGEILHIAQTSPNNGWGTWTSLGSPGTVPQGLAVGINADGRQEVFAPNEIDETLVHIWQVRPSNGWSTWASLGGPPAALPRLQQVAVGHNKRRHGSNQDGRLEVFAVSADGALWHIWQASPNDGWSGWFSLGTPPTTGLVVFAPVAVGSNQDERMEVFAAGNDGALWHIWQTTPNENWSDWASLGGEGISKAVVESNADGRLEVFVMVNGTMWHRWQLAPNSNSWSTVEA